MLQTFEVLLYNMCHLRMLEVTGKFLYLFSFNNILVLFINLIMFL